MPQKSKAAATAASETEDYTAYATKGATDLQERFAEWIVDKVDIDPSSYKTKNLAFAEGVRLAVALRMKFQASPENQAVLESRRVTAVADDEEPEPKPKATRKGRAKPKPEPVEEPEELDDEAEDDEEVEEDPRPKRRPARKTAAASVSAKPPAAKASVGKPKRRKAAAAASDAPF